MEGEDARETDSFGSAALAAFTGLRSVQFGKATAPVPALVRNGRLVRDIAAETSGLSPTRRADLPDPTAMASGVDHAAS